MNFIISLSLHYMSGLSLPFPLISCALTLQYEDMKWNFFSSWFKRWFMNRYNWSCFLEVSILTAEILSLHFHNMTEELNHMLTPPNTCTKSHKSQWKSPITRQGLPQNELLWNCLFIMTMIWIYVPVYRN